ncbi:MAG: TonB-dependent receptor [Rikenellaceae bacterium]
MKKITLILIAIIISTLSFAQSVGDIKIRLVDSKDASEVAGAYVTLTDSNKKSVFGVTGADGVCSFKNLSYGQYELSASFLGYDNSYLSINVNKSLVDVGDVKMKVKPMKIDEVTVMGTAIRTSQNGDTIIYNAEAYKVTADAVVEGLLAKMPGITVDDGEVEAQGEEVKKVFLDGKEFFGEDVALAVKNIPADIIAKVEVFNKLSDNAEFTGFDDGDSYKALNFVTKEGMNRGQFGKFTAGYNTDNLYQISASYNYFVDNHRLSISASSNNMNIKGFSSMDVGSSRRGGDGGGGRGTTSGSGSFAASPSGLSTSTGIGLNYGGSFAEEKLKIEASYFYNESDNEVNKETDRQYITDDDETQRYYDAISNSATDNYNHRFNGRIEYKPNSRHQIMMRPEFAYQNNGSSSYSFANNTESADGITFSDLSTNESSTTSEKDAYSVSNNIVYRALLGDNGRNIMVNANGSYSKNETVKLTSTDITYPLLTDTLTKQNILDGTTGYSVKAGVMYSEPIWENAMITANYNISHNYSDADYLVYVWEEQANLFNPDYDPTSSNIYNSGYTTHSVGPGFMYSKSNNLTINASLSYQSSLLANQQEVPVIEPSDLDYTFNNLTYSFVMRKTFNPTNSLRVTLRSNTQNPSVTDLQDVISDSNPQYVTSGNSLLEPSYSNSFQATYNRSNIEKGRTFMAMLSGNLTNNYIGESTIMLLDADDTYILPNGNSLESYGQYVKPVNLDGSWRITSSIVYGTPLYALYSNLNFNLGASYNESPSIFNNIDNVNMTTTYNAGASLGSNISQNADFTLSYNGGYNITDYKYELEGASLQKNSYMTHKLSASYKFVFWQGITLYGNTSYSRYKGITDDFEQNYLLSNLYIGKKLFKNQRGEISIGVNDMFNQSENFVRNITDTYIENVTSNTIGRYYGIKFTFDLRKFSGSNANMRGSGMSRERGGMGGDMGGGMGGRGGMM